MSHRHLLLAATSAIAMLGPNVQRLTSPGGIIATPADPYRPRDQRRRFGIQGDYTATQPTIGLMISGDGDTVLGHLDHAGGASTAGHIGGIQGTSATIDGTFGGAS